MFLKNFFIYAVLLSVGLSSFAQSTAISLRRAPATTEKASSTADYIVADYGNFIGDNTNFNGILRLKESTSGVIAEVYTAKSEDSGIEGGGSGDLMGLSNSVGSTSNVVPDQLVAQMILSKRADGAYTITDLKIISNQPLQMKGLIFQVNGIIDFNGQNSFGGPVIIYRNANSNAFREISFDGPVQR
jgi:hypothetical protein